MARIQSPVRCAIAVLGGLIVAGACGRPAPLLALLLLAVSLAGRRGLVAALAIGLLAGWWRPASTPPVQGAPIVLCGLLERPWRLSEDGWIGTLEVAHYRQWNQVERWQERVTVLVPGETPPGGGRNVRARGLLRRSPGLANVRPLAPGPWRLRLKSRRFLELQPAGRWDLWWSGGLSLRRRVETVMAASGERSGIQLARALTLGDASRLPSRWRRSLRAAGLAHLTALSGLHVGLLVGSCLIGGAALPRGVGRFLGVVAALGFLLIAGGRPALLRATCMGLLAAGALALGRRPQGLALLAILAMALAAAEPRLLSDIGYRLTCAATAGILWLSPRFEASWPLLPRWLRRPLAVSCGAQIGSLPWSLPAFGLLSPLAVVWNLAAVPWTALALAASLAWVMAALIWQSGAVWAAPMLDVAALPFAWVAELPPSIVRPIPLVTTTGPAILMAAGLAFVMLRASRRWPLAALPLLLALSRQTAPPALELRMLDVGQGEAILLRDGSEAILVDGGGWRSGDLGGRVLMPTLAAAGVRRLRAVVLTHPDLDHCRGLADLSSYLPIGEVWTVPTWRSNPCAHEVMTAPGTNLRLFWAGERARVGRWRLLALHPGAAGPERGNDRSLVLSAVAPGLRVLLTGDIEAAAERSLLRRWPASTLRADLLKVAHHGSASSTTAGLLAVVQPRLALISCGLGNHYGHPARGVLGRLEGAGALALRTDRSGEIVLRLQGRRQWRLATPGLPRPG